jgi:hypothetical protein
MKPAIGVGAVGVGQMLARRVETHEASTAARISHAPENVQAKDLSP